MMKFLMIGTIAMAIVGCGSLTPLQKLKQDVAYEALNIVFWGKEKGCQTTLWQEAVHYCKAHEEKPNCGPVLQIYVSSNGSTEIKGYGTSGNELRLPSFKTPDN